MKRISCLIFAILAVAFAVSVSCEKKDETPSEILNAADLTEALGDADPGDSIKLGSCRITGSFTVPAGVILEGTSREASILVTDGDDPALRITPGSEPTRVADLSIESNGLAGVLIKGDGEAVLERVSITATRGIGLGAEELDSLTLTDVSLSGPVTAANANSFGHDFTANDTATHGLVIVKVNDVGISNVTSSGFASFGALLVESTTIWQGGSVSDNMGTGLMVHDGSADLADLEMCGTLQGLCLIPPYGGVFVAGASVETTDLNVCEGEGIGMLHDNATATHVNLKAHDNGDAAVWAQQCPSIEVSGSDTEIVDNKFGGVVLVEVEEATISDAIIDTTVETTRVFEETGSVKVGDGIQVVKPMGLITMKDLNLSDNERVGILIDLEAMSMDNISLEDITVDATEDEQYGVIAQQGRITEGWDSGVTRLGTTADNDEGLATNLRIVGHKASDNMPSAADISLDGVASIIGDTG